ncbi:MAG: class I SAM-dependent methyltransferase [Candidatus Hermodarchaeota archaeon]
MSKEDIVISNMKKAFNILYNGKNYEFFHNILRNVYGDDYPEETDHNSFVTLTDLKNIVKYLEIGPDEVFIDLGCGNGGPGLWIARETGANYLGVDFSEVAVQVAAKRAEKYGFKDNTSYEVGNMCAMKFPDNSFDGAISIDTLGFVTDLPSAMSEIKRILRKNKRFVFTCWEIEPENNLNDFRPFLQNAGFEILIYEEIEDWERRQREVYQEVIKSKKQLIKEMGVEEVFIHILEAKKYLPRLKDWRKILAVAKKP